MAIVFDKKINKSKNLQMFPLNFIKPSNNSKEITTKGKQRRVCQISIKSSKASTIENNILGVF